LHTNATPSREMQELLNNVENLSLNEKKIEFLQFNDDSESEFSDTVIQDAKTIWSQVESVKNLKNNPAKLDELGIKCID
jgi:hypothetical protein